MQKSLKKNENHYILKINQDYLLQSQRVIIQEFVNILKYYLKKYKNNMISINNIYVFYYFFFYLDFNLNKNRVLPDCRASSSLSLISILLACTSVPNLLLLSSKIKFP